MKKQYEGVKIQLVEFDDKDVIATSGPELDDNEMPIL